MYLEIYTPDQKIFEGEVSSATFPGADGSFQILDNHAPLISALKQGKIKIKKDGNEEFFDINGGVIEVQENKVLILAE